MKYQKSPFTHKKKFKTSPVLKKSLRVKKEKDMGRIFILSELKKLWKIRPLPMKRINELKLQLFKWEQLKRSYGRHIEV